MNKKIDMEFYKQDALEVAPKLIGKLLVRKLSSGTVLKFRITEVEAYRGEEDSACHARFGITPRTKILYEEGGQLYVYLCYGIHYLLNIVTGKKNEPQAVLIRGIEGYDGPGKLTKFLNINSDFNGRNLSYSDEIWLEDDGKIFNYTTTKRVGINYAKEPYRSIEWRYIIKN